MSNSNDATCVANNVRLITMGTQQILMADVYSHHAEKPSYHWETRDNDTISRKARADGNNSFSGVYIPSSLVGRSITVWAGSEWAGEWDENFRD